MTTVEQTEALAVPRARKKRGWRRELRETWWRHLIGIVAVLFSLFPIAYVASGAFSAVPSISAATLIPDKLTLHNFGILFHDPSTHYARWYANTMIIAATTAIFTVLLGALAAYAFSRFRFKGRRMGLLSLLLIQMFPQLLLIVALYLIVLQTGKVFGFLGLNTLTGLIVVAPLMIASFAFNFNNFGNIYLLTGGGPAASDQTTAGQTDILISYTYKLAFASGKGNDYGLAAAIALIIFFIVASISALTFWKTKALENVR